MSTTSVRCVLVTGDGEGLGNALVHSLLRLPAHVEVIGLSRRPLEDVARYDTLSAEQRARYTHLRADLTSDSDLARAIAEIRRHVERHAKRLASVALVNGTGFLDTEVEAVPARLQLMETLNLTAPLALVRGIEDLFEPTAPILYYSGLLTHPTAHVPLVLKHADVKRRAASALRTAWPVRFKMIMPGAFRTDMLLDSIVRESAMLEWFAVPMSDPYARGALSDVVAGFAIARSEDVPDTFIRPRITRLLVTKNTPEELMKSLPGAIRRAARSILDETGQTSAQHDARVRFMQEHQFYGADFPYDDILSPKLWPGWLSKVYSASLRAARLVD